jgi:hypothetical protein
VLTVTGDATGPTQEFIRYIDHSPVAGWIGHATTGATATGAGKLELKLTLPLGKGEGAKVAGEYLFIGNDLRFGALPTLAKVNGRLAFTEQDLRAQDVAFEALGGPAKVRHRQCGRRSSRGRFRHGESGDAASRVGRADTRSRFGHYRLGSEFHVARRCGDVDGGEHAQRRGHRSSRSDGQVGGRRCAVEDRTARAGRTCERGPGDRGLSWRGSRHRASRSAGR